MLQVKIICSFAFLTNETSTMKKKLSETIKIFTLVGCVFVMFSCGSNTCVTCTMDGAESEEICQTDGDVDDVIYKRNVAAKEDAGFTCTE